MRITEIHIRRAFVIAGFAALCISLNAGCDRIGQSSGLPEIPSVEMRRLEPAVRQQLEEALAAVEQNPRDAGSNGRLAMILHAYKHYEAADVGYQRALLLEPDNYRWPYYHADVLDELGDTAGAECALRRGIELDSQQPWVRIRLAQHLISQSNLDDAQAQLQAAIRIQPYIAEALYEYGVLMSIKDDEIAAIDAFDEAIRLAPDNAAAYYRLAGVYRRRGESKMAEQNIALFRQHETSNYQPSDSMMTEVHELDISEHKLLQDAYQYLARGEADEGILVLRQIIEQNPNSAAAHTVLLGILSRRGEFDLADKHFELSYAIDPNNPQLYYNLGVARLSEGRLGAAEEAFRKVTQLDSEIHLAYARLGMVLDSQNRRQAAVEEYRKALQRDPTIPKVRLRLGLNLLSLGLHESAVDTLEKFPLTNDRMSGQALQALAKAYERLGRREDAKTTLRRAAEVAAAAGEATQQRAIEVDLRQLDREARE